MKLKIIIGLLCCLMFSNAYSQNNTFRIKGKIYDDETNEPLVGATIQSLSNKSIGTTSNVEGYFELPSSGTSDTIKISLLGYFEKRLVTSNGNVIVALKANAQELQSVNITANREVALRAESPVAITKLSPKLIDETKATQVFEIINKTPGVIMPSYNNEQHAMSIRQPMGTSAYYLYLEDGVPVRPLGIFNHNALLEINQFAISSIEVVKGPVSSIYGPEAVGGAINFIMQRPTVIPTARIGVQADNWGYKRVQFGTGATLGKFGFYIGGLSSKQTDSWMTNSDYDKNSVNVRLEYAFTNKTRLIGSFTYGKYYSQTTGSIDSIAFYNREYESTADFTYRKSDGYRSRITLEHDWNLYSKSFITLFQRKNKHGQNPSYGIRWNPVLSNTNDPGKARGEVNSNDFESYGLIAQHSRRFDFLSSKIIVGGVFDYSTNNYWAHRIDLIAHLRPDSNSVEKYTIDRERPDLPISNYDGIIKNSAIYFQYDFSPFEKVRISVGARHDLMFLSYENNINSTSGDISYQKITPKLGVTYELKRDMGLYANYSQGFSPPALTSIFRSRPNTTTLEFYTNLEPATFQNYEVGGWASVWKNKLYFDVAIFQMNGTNELLSIRQPDNSTDYQSAGKTLHRGLEFGLQANPSKEYSIRFGGTYALHRFEDFQISANQNDDIQNLSGYEMPSSPRTTWDTELSYYPKWFKNFRSSIEWQYISSWYLNQINTLEYEGSNLINFRAAYQWRSIEVFTNIINVTDELIANSATRGNNTTDRTTYNPGAPRTIMLGIQYNFIRKK